jgi:two-component system CheB/CheR fusion protein
MAAKLLGKPCSALTGTLFVSGVARKDRDAFLRHLRTASETESKVTGEVDLDSEDGPTVTVQLSTICLQQPSAQARQYRTAIADISDRRTAAVLESITDGFFSLDRDFRLTYVNREAEKLLGKSRQELLGHNLWHVFPEAVGSRFQREYERAMTRKQTVRFEEFYPPFNQWFAVHAYPSAIGLSVYFHDITGRKQVEEELRQSRAQLAWVLEKTGVGTWLNKLPFGDLNWDRQTRRLFFVPPDAKPTIELFWSRIHPDDREPTRLAVERAIRERSLYEMDHRAVNPATGEVSWIRSIGQATYAPDGSPTRFDGINYDITERKQAEAGLRHAASLLQATLESTADGLLVVDAAGKIRDFNQRFAQLWRIPETLLAARDDEAVLAFVLDQLRDPAAFLARVRELYATPKATSADVLEFKDGRVFERYSQPQWLDGRPAGRVWSFRDVTESRQAAAALHQSREDLNRAQAVGQIGSWRLDVQHDILTWSDENYRIFGVPKGTPLTYEAFLAIIHPDDRQYVDTQWQAALRGAPYDLEHRIVVDGHVKWVREKAYLEFDEAGKLLSGFGITQDITERKRAEKELKQLNATLERRVADRTEALTDANERLNAIMDSALVGILTLDERGIVQELNPMVAQIFGCSPDKIAGHNISRFMSCPDQAPAEEFLAHYLQAGEPHTGNGSREILGRHQDGRGIVLEVTMNEFAHADTRLFVAMLRDITDRKRLEREILEVGERERQRIGHDLHDGLGQHLHALYYMAGLLQQELKRESPARAREAGRLSKLLGKGLDLSRSLAHGLQPVNAVPEGLMLTLRELATRTGKLYRVDCRLECQARVLIHRHSAATHLYRIAQEAVNNAMKHGKPTRIRIQLKATRQQIILGVRDNGVGIRRRTGSSRGMGLHIMQYRADAIGGSLAIRRHPRGGTEVVCTVPRQALLPGENEIK